MFDDLNIEALKERGFIGAVASAENGSIAAATSDDLDVFGGILGYVSQVGDMIGEPFGMDSIEEIHMIGDSTTAICIPQEDGNLGVLCSSRANVDAILDDLI